VPALVDIDLRFYRVKRLHRVQRVQRVQRFIRFWFIRFRVPEVHAAKTEP
jgi:predicted 2-oxoglutarate/Fe(II)-dependent dioxygenase YbiX